MSENQLNGYFAFDDSDLIANKASRLSPKQTKKLTPNDRFTQRILLCVAFAYAVYYAKDTKQILSAEFISKSN